MILALVLAAALGSGGVEEFKTAFPGASVVESPGGGRLTSASGFEALGLGDAPETAARAFLRRYGAAFGLTARQELVVHGAPRPGQLGAVRFERRIGGLPLFDGDVVVGVDARNAVILVNGTDVPTRLKGRFRISRKAAIRAARAALPGLVTSDEPRTARGWHAAAQVVRPVWRVELTAARPAGDWRTYVDAETGRVLSRVDLRADAPGPDAAPPRGELGPPAPRR